MLQTKYRIKLCIGIPTQSTIEWRMVDLGYEFTDYIECRKFVERLETINGTEGTAIDFWISSTEEYGKLVLPNSEPENTES